MKTFLIISSIFFSITSIAQPSVSGRTAPAMDTIIFLPSNSVALTGTATQANPGHPILDTSWVKTSGPAATITNSSNRMTTTVTGLVAGAYVFTLTATDKNNSASAKVNVKVVSAILPISLAYFRVSKNDNDIILTWQTSMESNNSGFIIQKTIGNSDFVDIAFITTKAVNGQSSTDLNYDYQINTAAGQAGMSGILLVMTILASLVLISKSNLLLKYLILSVFCLLIFSCTKSVSSPEQHSQSSKTGFRLKQIDKDGHYNYSEVVVVN
jgi:hypothetical protein